MLQHLQCLRFIPCSPLHQALRWWYVIWLWVCVNTTSQEMEPYYGLPPACRVDCTKLNGKKKKKNCDMNVFIIEK